MDVNIERNVGFCLNGFRKLPPFILIELIICLDKVCMYVCMDVLHHTSNYVPS